MLGGAAPELQAPLAGLLDEHYQLLATARELAERARALLQTPRDLRERAAALAGELAGHERREREALARRRREA